MWCSGIVIQPICLTRGNALGTSPRVRFLRKCKEHHQSRCALPPRVPVVNMCITLMMTSMSKSCGRLYQRKFFYLLTCEYCLSHMSLFGRLRQDMGRLEIENTQRETQGAAEAGNRADA